MAYEGVGIQSIIGTSIDLAKEEVLQQKVAVTSPGLPLADVLDTISAQYHVSLSASRPASDQRFTIATQDLPLHTLMREVARTMSHKVDGPPEYEWRKLQANGKDQYVLVSLVSFATQQRRERTAEKEHLRVLLRELRDLLGQPVATGTGTESHFMPELLDPRDAFHAVFHQAIRALRDRDVDALARTGLVPVPASSLTEATKILNRERSDTYSYMLSNLKEGQEKPLPPTPVEVGSSVYLRVVPNDFNGAYPGQRYEYAVMLEGVFSDQWIVIDPYYPFKPPLASPTADDLILDLTPTLKPSESYQDNLPATLIAIARAAKINIVQEHFYKVSRFNSPIKGLRPEQQKGKLTAVLNDVCRIWNYTAIKEGDVYRLWSLTWSMDRDCDIPERQLKPWRRTLERQGKFTVDDQIRLATQFTWGQIAVTLKQAFPLDLETAKKPGYEGESVTYFPHLGRVEQYGPLRLQGLLNSDERQAALLKEGIPITTLRSELQEEAFRSILAQERVPQTQKRMDTVRARLATARLYLKPPSAAFRIPMPMSVEIIAAPE